MIFYFAERELLKIGFFFCQNENRWCSAKRRRRFFLNKKTVLSQKKKSRNYRDFWNKKLFDYLLLSLILAFLPVSSLK